MRIAPSSPHPTEPLTVSIGEAGGLADLRRLVEASEPSPSR